MIHALREFSRTVRSAMSQKTKGSFLWIILLQNRHFSMGWMGVLAEVSTIHSGISAKRAVISHVELPTKLVTAIVTPER